MECSAKGRGKPFFDVGRRENYGSPIIAHLRDTAAKGRGCRLIFHTITIDMLVAPPCSY